MKLLSPKWPLRLAGAALLLAGCRAVAPYHVPESWRQPSVAPKSIQALEAIERGGLKVLLRRGSSGLKLSCRSGLRLVNPMGGATLAEFGAGSKAQLLASQSRLLAQGRRLEAREALLEPLEKRDAVLVGGLSYRGRLFLKAAGDSLLLVNEVGLDEYLYGVLPGEVGTAWPLEALKAQAVTARTYALFRTEHSESKLFDLDDSTRSQVYGGMAKEAPKTCQAVDETSGLVLIWQGRPAEAFFHSNCGGHTADAGLVWGTKIPYLRGVEDSFCESGAHFAWSCEIGKEELLRRLARAGIKLTDFEGIEATDEDASGRYLKVRFSGGGAGLALGSQAFRNAAGPDLIKSTRFQVTLRGDTLHFEGKGWGHGVGLCQEGAWAMAKGGYRSRDILAHYFPGAKVRRLGG